MFTEHGDGVWRGRQRLADDQQKHDQSQQDGDLKVDLLSRLYGQEEAEERHGVDEETGEDEVDYVEEAASRHVDREGDVGVGFDAAGVCLLVARHRQFVYVPLLVLRLVVDRVVLGAVVGQVDLEIREEKIR